MHSATLPPASSVAIPPTGTVSFLFTDIEGSTQRWDRDREAMQDAVRRHDALMRSTIAAHGGYVFKTIGDAFCAAFPSAASAIRSAAAAQTALAREDFGAVDGVRVRMAIHTGTADERDCDYFGPTVNRVARLLSIGHGGQVLLSQVTADLARAEHQQLAMHDLGEHRLKDLSEPEHVYQLDLPDLPATFPALRSVDAPADNLPRDVTSFVGRERDVAELTALLREHRLVSLVGAGGVGKTRCALRVAGSLGERFRDGVWFVDLAPITDPAIVAGEVAQAVHVVESPQRALVETLAAHLRTKSLLIVLDNCEHVIDACSALVAALLHACPAVSFLTTSREALKVGGECVYPLSTLAVPGRDVASCVDSALRYSAVALFVARARAADSRFNLTCDNVRSVVEICRRLDGMPLAIELAAARVKVLAPAQLERKLDERFRILTNGVRTALPRQQTMRALIDWSYDLLDDRERTLLRTLSIFAGSFALEAAIALGVRDGVEDYDVIDLLTSLVDKSLVVVEPGDRDTRYRLLESMRQYGRERLAEHGDHADAAARHAAAFTEIAERIEREYEDEVYRSWITSAEREIENIRAALSWAFGADGDAAIGQRLAATVRRIFNTSHPAEARRWVRLALERTDASTPAVLVARLHLADAHLSSTLNAFNAALGAARRAVTAFELVGDVRGLADAQRWAGRSMMLLGSVAEGEALLRSALATYTACGFRHIGGLLRDLGSARAASGDVVGARELFARALRHCEHDQDDGNLAITAGTLAEAEFAAGDADAALAHVQTALASARALNGTITVWLTSNAAAFLIALDRFGEARATAAAALANAVELQSEIDVVVLLQHLAAAFALEPAEAAHASADRFAVGARLIGYVDARLRAMEIEREYTERQEYERTMTALEAVMGTETLAAHRLAGEAMSEDRAVETALATAR